LRGLERLGCRDVIIRSSSQLDLRDQEATLSFFKAERPTHVFLAAARVGGIHANNAYPAEFIRDNLLIQTSVIMASHAVEVERLLFLGSSCIYPKHAPQPIVETSLLTGSLESTNRPYAIAKIAGIEMCWSYNRQYGTRYLAVMPTNLYGPGDNYHPDNSHVIPALIRKFVEARENGIGSVKVWGTGTPRREFLTSDDMADACLFLAGLEDDRYDQMLGSSASDAFSPPIVNVGYGSDVSIAELAHLIAAATDYTGSIEFDISKPDGTPRKLLDSSRLRGLGWRPSTKLEDGLRVAVADFRSMQSARL
jgi:GDP-L-fucose synthase